MIGEQNRLFFVVRDPCVEKSHQNKLTINKG